MTLGKVLRQAEPGGRAVTTVTTRHCLSRSATTAVPNARFLAITRLTHRSFGSSGSRRTATFRVMGGGAGLDDARTPSWFAPRKARDSTVTQAQGSRGADECWRAGSIFVL